MKKSLFVAALLLSAAIISAQKSPIKYGTVSLEEMKQEIYPLDSSAAAIVLCDFGEYIDSKFTTYRNLRIKILKKEGLHNADLAFRGGKNMNIRGITYNLENGKIVETKLKAESVKITRIFEDIYITKVAMPNVKVGSIIDLEFEYSLLPDSWDFQRDIPVLHSELYFEVTRYFSYRKQFFGFQPLAFSSPNHWIAKNMPAFKAEPYITSSKNYRTRLEFDISNVSIPGYYYKSYSDSWATIRDRLYEDPNFGEALAAGNYMTNTAEQIKAKCSTREEMIKMAFEFVKQIKWNQADYFLTTTEGIKNCFTEKSGNATDINFALIQLLRKLDFKAYPVIMSTRENGKLITYNPSLTKLNYVIAAVFTENDTLLLDATEKRMPYNLLPFRVLNGEGIIVDKKFAGPIEINVTGKKDSRLSMFQMEITPDNVMKGKLTYSYNEYAALDFRNNYAGFTSNDEYLNSFTENKPGFKVISYNVKNIDSIYLPVYEEFELEKPDAMELVGDDYLLFPLFFEAIAENPFKASERKYPIDFGYLRENQVIATYTLPEGYKILSMPKSLSLRLPDNSASVVYKTAADGNRLQVTFKLKIDKTLFIENEYPDLKEFYNQVVNKINEPVVLQKQ